MKKYLIGLLTGVLLTAGSVMFMGAAHRIYNPWSTFSERGSNYLRSETLEKRLTELNNDISEIGGWVYEIRVNRNNLTHIK